MDIDVFKDNYSMNRHIEYFMNKVEKNRKREPIKTPWTGLNEKLSGGLYPGLYCLGAISSLGKTAMALQLADYIAEKYPVIFFTIEMPRTELIARSVSRLSFEDNPVKNRCISTLSVLHGCYEDVDTFSKYSNEYFNKTKYLSINEGSFDTTVMDIGNQLRVFIENVKVRPVVFVDYLQIIEAGKTDNEGKLLYLNDKQSIDYITKTLKQISRNLDICMIVVSSFNRQSYKSPVSHDCFKESGAIEYTSDVLMGLQLSVLDNGVNKNDTNIDARLNTAKSKIPREVTLVILKQRNGSSFVKQKFDFYPANNYFKEV